PRGAGSPNPGQRTPRRDPPDPTGVRFPLPSGKGTPVWAGRPGGAVPAGAGGAERRLQGGWDGEEQRAQNGHPTWDPGRWIQAGGPGPGCVEGRRTGQNSQPTISSPPPKRQESKSSPPSSLSAFLSSLPISVSSPGPP